MRTETIQVDAGYNSVMEAVKETFHSHYHEFRIEEEQGSGFYEVRHNRKDVKIGVYAQESGAEVELMDVPNQLTKKIKSALNALDGGSEKRTPSRSDRKEDKRQYERMMEKQTGRGVKRGDSSEDSFEVVESFDDGSIRFQPPFTKDEATYREHEDEEGGKACADCAHYIDGGGCHLVQGGIDPDFYCAEFYADVGMFGHASRGSPLLNLIMWGEQFEQNFDDADVEDLLNLMESAMENRLRSGE